jgi:hypothetical protein
VKALAALLRVCMLFGASVVLLFGVTIGWCVQRVARAGSFVVLILAHLCASTFMTSESPVTCKLIPQRQLARRSRVMDTLFDLAERPGKVVLRHQ